MLDCKHNTGMGVRKNFSRVGKVDIRLSISGC